MEKKDFSHFRHRLNKTQKQMAQLLGTSLKAIHSYEQGWRKIPPHVERQIYFLLAKRFCQEDGTMPCWVTLGCPDQRRENCPAWEFHAGEMCWFINGTICQGDPQGSWSEKMEHCRKCPVFKNFLSIVENE